MLPPTFVPGFHDEAAVRLMRYNDLGCTGLKVSHLGLGGGPLAAGMYWDFSEDDAIAAVREAIRQGVNYIDTAPYYGMGKSEELLGKALKGIPRQAYYIATKVGRYEMDPRTMFDFSAEKTKESFEKSLKLLQLDYVDIIQVHDVDMALDPDIVVKETIPALRELVASGRARFLGITAYSLDTLKTLSERAAVDTVLSFARDTLMDDALQGYLPYFKEKGIGIICAAGAAMGLLTNFGPHAWHPAPQEIKDYCRRVSEYCKEQGVELARLAVHHALTREGQSTHLVGVNSTAVLRSNLQLLREGLTPAEQKVLRDVKEKFFKNMPKRNWEGAEMEKFKKEWKKLGMI